MKIIKFTTLILLAFSVEAPAYDGLYEIALAKYQVAKLKSNVALISYKVEKSHMQDPRVCLQTLMAQSSLQSVSRNDSADVILKKIDSYDRVINLLTDRNLAPVACQSRPSNPVAINSL